MQAAVPVKLLRWLSHPGATLSRRALHATVWTLGTKGFQHSLNYVRIIILANLLAPLDFGLMGIGLVVIAALETITVPGLQEALVQKSGDVKEYLDTFWTLTFLRTFAIAVILILAAPYLAIFFKSPDATHIMQAVAAAEFLRGLVNPGILYFQRELEFHKRSINEVVPVVAEIAVGIAAAFILHNVWALVFGFLARRVIQVAVSYLTHSYRPRISLKRDHAKDLFAFGRWVYLTRIVNFIAVQSDSIVLTRLLGPLALGFYQMGQRTASIPLAELHRGISAVAFPLFSRVQDDQERLKKGFLKGFEAITSLIVPLAVAIFIMAPEFVRVALGEKWLPAVPAMQVLAVSSGLYSVVAASSGQLFNGIGKPWINFQMSFVKAAAVGVLVFPLATKFGITGAAYSVLISSSLAFVFGCYKSYAILRPQPSEYLKAILPAALAGGGVALVAVVSKQLLSPINLPDFLLVGCLLAATYAGVFLRCLGNSRAGYFRP